MIDQISGITELINWVNLNQSLQVIIKESIEDSLYNKVYNKISIHKNNVERVKETIDIFLKDGGINNNIYVIEEPGQQKILDKRTCNGLRNMVNAETEQVNVIIRNYHSTAKDFGINYPKPLFASCIPFNDAVKNFNDAIQGIARLLGFNIENANYVVIDLISE